MIWVTVLAVAATLPSFEFKGLQPGHPLSQSQMHLRWCSTDYDRLVQKCSIDTDEGVAGARILTGTVEAFRNEFFKLSLEVSHQLYGEVLRALSAKYGKPCHTTNETVKNRLGAEFNSRVIAWCFSNGTLVFSEIGSDTGSSHLFFIDDSRASQVPEEPARVDF